MSAKSAKSVAKKKPSAPQSSVAKKPAKKRFPLAGPFTGADVYLKSWGKEAGKGALAALGGFVMSSITAAIFGDPTADALKAIGEQLKGISTQLARIETTLKELVDINRQILSVLEEILKAEKLDGPLKELQVIFNRIQTNHQQLLDAARNINDAGKPLKTKDALKRDLADLTDDIKGLRGGRPLREEFNRIDTILFGSPALDGVFDVFVNYLMKDVRKSAQKAYTFGLAMDRLENFARWLAWAQHKAVNLLVNLEVKDRADPAVPTASELSLQQDLTARLDRLSLRLVVFAEKMAAELDVQNEFFGGLNPKLLHCAPSAKPWVQLTSSAIDRADRVRDVFLGRSTLTVRLAPHVPLHAKVEQRAGGRAPNLYALALDKPLPKLLVKIGGVEKTVTPSNDAFRGVDSNDNDVQNPPFTHGLIFFVYECDIEAQLKEATLIPYTVSLHPTTEAYFPTYRYSALDRGLTPVLTPLTGNAGGVNGGVSLTAMTYSCTTETQGVLSRFLLRNLEYPGYVLGADAAAKKTKMVPENKGDLNQLWFFENRGSGDYLLLNAGTGLIAYYPGGNQQPIKLSNDKDELARRGKLALWGFTGRHETGVHYSIACAGDTGQNISALISDVPPSKQHRRRKVFRLGTDEVRTIGRDVLGHGGHLFWKLETLDGTDALARRDA